MSDRRRALKKVNHGKKQQRLLNWESYNFKKDVRESLTEMEVKWEPCGNLRKEWFRKREQHKQRPWGSLSSVLEKKQEDQRVSGTNEGRWDTWRLMENNEWWVQKKRMSFKGGSYLTNQWTSGSLKVTMTK